jgi:hypothetical protein
VLQYGLCRKWTGRQYAGQAQRIILDSRVKVRPLDPAPSFRLPIFLKLALRNVNISVAMAPLAQSKADNIAAWTLRGK